MATKKGSVSSREGQGGRIPEGGMGYTGPGSDYLSGSVTSASRSAIAEGTRKKGEKTSSKER